MAVRQFLRGQDLTVCTLYGGNYSAGAPSWGSGIVLAGTSLLDGVGFSFDQGALQVNGIDDLYAHNIKTIIDIRAYLNLYLSSDATLGNAIVNLMSASDLAKIVLTYAYNSTTRTITYQGIWDTGAHGIEQIGANVSRINLKPINNANASPLVIS